MKIRLPYWFFLFILAALQFFINCGIYSFISNEGYIHITDTQYFIFTCIISLTSTMFGAVWVAGQKSWDIENFALRVQNINTCDHIIFRITKQKEFLNARSTKNT